MSELNTNQKVRNVFLENHEDYSRDCLIIHPIGYYDAKQHPFCRLGGEPALDYDLSMKSLQRDTHN